MQLTVPLATTAERLTITPIKGELIYDETLGKVYYGNNSTVGGVELGGGSGSTSGSYLPLSGGTLTGTLALTGASIDFDSTYSAPYKEGRLFYDNANKTLAYYNEVSDVTVNIGQEHLIRVKNNTGSTITNGSVCYVSGSLGDNITVALAKADSALTSRSTIGIATHDIAVNDFGYICRLGVVHGLNTNAYNAGDTLYLSPTTAGEMTSVEPIAPYRNVRIGYVCKKSAGDGHILVDVQDGLSLSELNDVVVSSISGSDILQYNSVSGVWNNKSLTDAGILKISNNLLDVESISAARFNLGIESFDEARFEVEEFLSNGSFYLGLGASNAGGSANTTVTPSDGTRHGVLNITCGATASTVQRGGYAQHLASQIMGNGYENFYGFGFNPGTPGASADGILIHMGLHQAAGGESGNSIGFRLSSDIGNDNVFCVCRASNVETAFDTGITYSGWKDLSFWVNSDRTSVKFYKGNTLLTTITTNIPSAAMGVKLMITRKNATTTNVGCQIDYFAYGRKYDMSNRRFPNFSNSF